MGETGRVPELTPFDESEGRLDLDLATAAVMARVEDQPMLMKMLADQLGVGLGQAVTVQREGGLLRRSDAVRSVEVTLGQDVYRADVTKGRVACRIGHSSGGIVIRNESVELDEWVKRLLGALQAEALRSQQTRRALERLVFGGYA